MDKSTKFAVSYSQSEDLDVKLLVVTLGLFLMTNISLAAATCPVGAKEERLTFQRVMRNFGRFTMPADMLALRGVNPNEKITDQEIQTAIEKLDVVVACAAAVIANPADDLLPASTRSLAGEKRQEYIDDLVYFLTDFRDGISDYRAMWSDALKKPYAQRDFQRLLQKSEKIDDLVNRAHKKL